MAPRYTPQYIQPIHMRVVTLGEEEEKVIKIDTPGGGKIWTCFMMKKEKRNNHLDIFKKRFERKL